VKPKSPAKQLDGFLAEYDAAVAREARSALGKMRKLLPAGTVEMVYDNYNALVIGFGATDRPSEAVLSLAIMPRWVTLCFIWGKNLPDPRQLLKGVGNQVRNVRLTDGITLDDPAIKELIAHAVMRSATPFDGAGRRKMIIKSISAKRRPRRPVGDG
jgi:hypothetical protein